MAKFCMGVSIGGPGQTSAIVIITRGQEAGPIDSITLLPRVAKTIEVRKVERLAPGQKDAEIVERINRILGEAPLTGNTSIFVVHPGGAPALSAMKPKFRPGAYPWGVNVQKSAEEGWTSGQRNVSMHEMVSYLVPECQDAKLRIPPEFAELSAQIVNVMPEAEWHVGNDDLANALFLATWFSRGASSAEIGQVLREAGFC